MGSSDDEGDNRVPKVLARNTACHPCRKRKLKCDAVKPICTHCQKYFSRHANSSKANLIECTWDPPKARRHGRGEGDEEGDNNTTSKKARITELEDRLAAFEKALKEQRGTGDPSPSVAQDATGATLPATVDNSSNNFIPHNLGQTGQKDMRMQDGTPSMWFTEITSATAQGRGSHNSSLQNFSPDSGFGTGFAGFTSDIFQAPPAPLGQHSYDMIWPDWPIDLPTLDVVDHMAGVFFDKVATFPKMIHRATFMSSLQLPPSHPQFPCQPLLHAILALTANHVSPERLATRAYFPVGTPLDAIFHPEQDLYANPGVTRTLPLGSFHASGTNAVAAPTPFARFQLWHRRKAMESMTSYVDKGMKFLECLQAQILVTAVDQYNAWWTDLWMMTGSAVRLAIPMRINESPNIPADALKRATLLLIEEPADALEQATRDRTWWITYLLERSAGMATTWANAINDDEITVELPVSQKVFDQGYGELLGTQTFQSPDFYSRHPDRHMDSLSFMIKAMRLVTDVNIFLRRYTRASHSADKYANNPDVRTLLSRINSFRLSFPPHLRRPLQAMSGPAVDVDLLAAMMLVHCATVTIAEPMVTRQHWTTELARVALGAIRASLSMLYDISSTSFDLTLLPVHCSFSWCLCSRVLCKFIDASLFANDGTTTNVFRSEMEVFRMAMKQYGERYPSGIRHLQMTDDLLEYTGNNNVDNVAPVYECTRAEMFNPEYTGGNIKSRSATTPSSTTQTTDSASASYPQSINSEKSGFPHIDVSELNVNGIFVNTGDDYISTTYRRSQRTSGLEKQTPGSKSSPSGVAGVGYDVQLPRSEKYLTQAERDMYARSWLTGMANSNHGQDSNPPPGVFFNPSDNIIINADKDSQRSHLSAEVESSRSAGISPASRKSPSSREIPAPASEDWLFAAEKGSWRGDSISFTPRPSVTDHSSSSGTSGDQMPLEAGFWPNAKFNGARIGMRDDSRPFGSVSAKSSPPVQKENERQQARTYQPTTQFYFTPPQQGQQNSVQAQYSGFVDQKGMPGVNDRPNETPFAFTFTQPSLSAMNLGARLNPNTNAGQSKGDPGSGDKNPIGPNSNTTDFDLFEGLDMTSTFGVDMGLGGGFDENMANTAGGFGFDISSFSFDVSEFTSLFNASPGPSGNE